MRQYSRTNPLVIFSRGLTRRQVAALVGLSPSGFDKAGRENRYPKPTLPGGRYDRKLYEKVMNRLSGIDEGESKANDLDVWRRARGSR
jgi:hypothetical protein